MKIHLEDEGQHIGTVCFSPTTGHVHLAYEQYEVMSLFEMLVRVFFFFIFKTCLSFKEMYHFTTLLHITYSHVQMITYLCKLVVCIYFLCLYFHLHFHLKIFIYLSPVFSLGLKTDLQPLTKKQGRSYHETGILLIFR